MAETDQLYVPGQWRCPKCNFVLYQRTLHAADGTVSARDEPGEPCPNCKTPLWRVSWKEQAAELEERCIEQIEERRKVEEENTRLRKVISAVCDALPNGAFCAPACSVEFMEQVPGEVRSVIAGLIDDKKRLDFLDHLNGRLNDHYKTTYRWKFIINHNVNRVMLTDHRRSLDLYDSDPHGYSSCRHAIDEHRRRSEMLMEAKRRKVDADAE